tara:strand:- start:3578 stop:4060 length:483 start_codon:yes stop_codon:yes gene_type:complete
MAALVGLSSTGPVAGGLFAAAQSAAMGGSVTPLATMGGIAIAATLPAAVVAGVAAEYADSQQHGMGDPTAELTANSRFVLVVHNWGIVEMREFATYEAARAAFDTGRNLRRFLVRVHDANEPDRDNGHGWPLPWHELHHDGWGAILDNGMRHELLKRIRP